MTKKEDLKFFDPQIEFKEQAVAERLQYLPNSKIPLPSEVEISESGMCNENAHFVHEAIQITIMLMNLFRLNYIKNFVMN